MGWGSPALRPQFGGSAIEPHEVALVRRRTAIAGEKSRVWAKSARKILPVSTSPERSAAYLTLALSMLM
jgi:hypothetical protein